MKKTLLLICAGVTLIAASCKKDDDNKTATPATRAEIIKGTWTISELGGDMNNNGVLDAGETIANNSGSLVFNDGGTGTGSLLGVSYPFTWSLTNNDNTLRIVVASDVTNYDIKELSSTKAVVLDASTDPDTWTVLTK